MKKLVCLLALTMFIGSMASAAVVIVNKSGDPGTTNTVAGAAAIAAAGDTILINDNSSSYTETARIVLKKGCSIIGGTNPPPVIRLTVLSLGGIDGEDMTVKNVDVDMGSGGWAYGFRIYGNFLISKVNVFAKNEGSSVFLLDPGPSPMVTKGRFEYVTTANFAQNSGVVKFGGGWNSTYTNVPDATGGTTHTQSSITPDTVGPILFNHCTFTYQGGYVSTAGFTWPTNGGEITFKNCILGCMYTDMDVFGDWNNGAWSKTFSGTFFFDWGRGIPLMIHKNNLYMSIWMMIAYDYTAMYHKDGSGAGFIDTGVYPSAALGEIGGQFTNQQPFALRSSNAGYFKGSTALKASGATGTSVLDMGLAPTTITLTNSAPPLGMTAVTPVVKLTDAVGDASTPWTGVSVVLTGTTAAGAAQTETIAAVHTAGTANQWKATAANTYGTLTHVTTTITCPTGSGAVTIADTQLVGFAITNHAKLTKDDLKLQPNFSAALWKGDDGLHMGSDITTLPVELSTFEIE